MLAPILRDRRAQLDSHLKSKAPWLDKPVRTPGSLRAPNSNRLSQDDVLMWLLEEAARKGYPDEIVTLFFLVAEVPAIGTTSSVVIMRLCVRDYILNYSAGLCASSVSSCRKPGSRYPSP